MSKIKSSKVAVFLNASTSSTANWARMGKGITSLPISYGAKTTTECYVNEDNATTTVDGYEIGIDTEQTAIKGDAIFDYVDGIRKSLKTGSECETEALLVNIYDLSEGTGGVVSGTAQKFGATVAITDFELNGGEIAKIKYKVSLNGDPSNVTASISSAGVLTVS